jgi:hypothetical protein
VVSRPPTAPPAANLPTARAPVSGQSNTPRRTVGCCLLALHTLLETCLQAACQCITAAGCMCIGMYPVYCPCSNPSRCMLVHCWMRQPTYIVPFVPACCQPCHAPLLYWPAYGWDGNFRAAHNQQWLLCHSRWSPSDHWHCVMQVCSLLPVRQRPVLLRVPKPVPVPAQRPVPSPAPSQVPRLLLPAPALWVLMVAPQGGPQPWAPSTTAGQSQAPRSASRILAASGPGCSPGEQK